MESGFKVSRFQSFGELADQFDFHILAISAAPAIKIRRLTVETIMRCPLSGVYIDI
jgi:hypothetical protein